MEKAKLLETLTELLTDVLRARFEGTAYAKLAHVAVGVPVGPRELLTLVGEVRRRFVAEQDEAALSVA